VDSSDAPRVRRAHGVGRDVYLDESEQAMISLVPRVPLGRPVLAGLIVLCGCAPAVTRGDAESGTLITAEDLARYPGEPIERVIERKVPGVMVTRTPDGGIVLRIRGSSSIDGRDRPPLYVVDGAPVAPGPDGALSVSPHDIESIRVLKGADAALYGIDGANGVIVVTTRKSSEP
jgi:TonB-dependent SusC/RagA subfamily outer membrane receptor